MSDHNENNNDYNDYGIMKAPDVAKMLKMKIRWVYDHVDELGGVKIGHALFFTERSVLDAVQRQGKKSMASSYKNQGRKKAHPPVADKETGNGVGEKDIDEAGKERRAAAKRHGLIKFVH